MTVASFAAPSPELGFFPPGAMVMMTFQSGQVPPGWFPCDGRTVAQDQFPALFAAIGTRYNTGGEPGGHFRLPNVTSESRHMRGAPNVTLPSSAATGGSNTHNHSWTSSVNFGLSASGSHGHNLNGYINTGVGSIGSHTHGSASNLTGTSNSNHNKGNGSRSVAIASHSHPFNSNTSNQNHDHNHNHNLSNLSINANVNHESLHFVGSTNNTTSASANQELATFLSTMMIKT